MGGFLIPLNDYLAWKLLQLVWLRTSAPMPSMSICAAVQLPWELWRQLSAVQRTSQEGFAFPAPTPLNISTSPFFSKLWHSVSLHLQAPLPCTLIDGRQQQLSQLLAQEVT